jgi:hypothetical protein
VVNRSVVVRRRVRGFRKGSGKGLGVLRGVVEVGVRGSWCDCVFDVVALTTGTVVNISN